nr:hypothetical protein [Mycobacterium sp.]
MRDTPGVTAVHIIGPTGSAVVTVTRGGPSAAQLTRVVADAEKCCGAPYLAPGPPLPGDDAILASRITATAVSTVGLGVAALGSLLPVRGIPRLLVAPVAMADHHPKVLVPILAHSRPCVVRTLAPMGLLGRADTPRPGYRRG